jgi:hypothetical protein
LIAARCRRLADGLLRDRGSLWNNGVDLGRSLSCDLCETAEKTARLEIVDGDSDDDGEGGEAETSDCVETHIG